MADVAARSRPALRRAGWWWWWAACLALAGAVAAAAFSVRLSREMADFDVYWRAGVRAAAAEPLYREADGHYQLKYLPAFAVLAVPLGAMPRETAAAVWFALSLAALGGLLAASLRLLPERRRPAALLVGAALVVFGKFYARELLLGQVNLFFALACVLAVLALQRRRDAAAGALVSLAIVLKPYAVLLLPWMALRGRPAPVAWTLAGLALVAVLPAVAYGSAATVGLHREWLEVVLGSTPPNLLNPDNVSWLAMYSRWFGIGPLAGALAMATGIAALALVAWAMRAGRSVPRPEGLELSLLLLAMPLLSPQGWDYVLLVATPAVPVLVNGLDRLPASWRIAAVTAGLLVGLTFHDVMGRTLYHAFLSHGGITIAAVVMMGALAVLRRQRAA